MSAGGWRCAVKLKVYMQGRDRTSNGKKKIKERMRLYPFLDHGATSSFLIDLNDDLHYRYLTFSTLARHLLTIQGLEGKEGNT